MPMSENLAQRRSNLSTTKQILLEKRRQSIASMEERLDPIPQRPQNLPAPASFAQQRFWFMHQLDPGNTAYNEVKTSRIHTPLNTTILTNALLAIMQRHEIVRTNFAFSDGQVYQIIHPYADAAAQLSVPEFDLQHTPEAEREQEARHIIQSAAQKPFDLAQDFLWRTLLIRMGETETLLVSIIHHILCDSQGLDIFEKELRTLYSALQEDQPSPLPELELQYADFAYWERQRSQGDLWQQQLTYWRQTLATISNQPLLYGDRPRQFVQNAHKASISFTVPASVTAKLRDLGSCEGATVFMVLLATFQLLLFQYSGQDDIVVGTPISSRSRPEFEPLIGCFINMLALRTDFSGDLTFQALLQSVRTISLSAYANRDVPFEKLVADLAPERQKSRNPFFQILLDFQNAEQAPESSSKKHAPAHNIAVDVSQFDLVLGLWDNGTELAGELFYLAEFFDASTVEDIRTHFLLLLDSVTTNPMQPVRTMPDLTATERQALANWNKERLHGRSDLQDSSTPEQPSSDQEDETAPRTPLEEILAEIWAQTLGVEWVGIYDNFFKIGGHSLLATQLLVQIQDILTIEIPLQLVFDAPTIATFAEALMNNESTRAHVERTIELLLSVTELSEDEVQARLVAESQVS